MKERINASDWSVAVVDLGTHLFEARTLQTENWFKQFCEEHGYKLVSFAKGTNRLCQ